MVRGGGGSEMVHGLYLCLDSRVEFMMLLKSHQSFCCLVLQVIMEDEGSGCVYRLFLIFNHQVQNYHLFRWILRCVWLVHWRVSRCLLARAPLHCI